MSQGLKDVLNDCPLGCGPISLTYDGATVKGYVDGCRSSPCRRRGAFQARGNELRLGVDGGLRQPQGAADEVRIYNRRAER